MINNSYYSSTGDRSFIRDIIKENEYSAIDIGGGCGGVFRDVVEAILDINDYQIPNVKLYKGDMNLQNVWDTILHDRPTLAYESGLQGCRKYDFAICSMTLEDISNPLLVCNNIERIAKRGVIIVPSKYRELSRGLHGSFRGFIHHHSIFNIERAYNGSYCYDVLKCYPKLNLIEDARFDSLAGHEDKTELIIFWEDKIDLKMVNDGFLGPTHDDVQNYYNQLFDK